MAVAEDKIREALKAVIDPELFVNIVDLGLIYEIKSEDQPEGKSNVVIEMTMTSPACPAGPQLLSQSLDAVKRLDGVAEVDVKLVMEPPWTPDRMTEDAGSIGDLLKAIGYRLSAISYQLSARIVLADSRQPIALVMHVFLYEWATGGGLVDAEGSVPPSLVREGAAMIGALAADLVRIPGCKVSALRDPRVLQLALPGSTVVDVISRTSHREEFERLSSTADGTILIAPEFDGILWKSARLVVTSGGRLMSPSPEFIRVAGDKQRTCETLAVAGVPVPAGKALEPDEPLPAKFEYPAVLKPADGAGSQDTYMVSSRHDVPPAHAWRRRLERYVPGLAASVAMLCGPGGHVPLEPCKQRISEDGRLRYLGGELPLSGGLAERARSLAERALAAMPPAVGYVGVDLVLGREPDGIADAVIEINPRLTTSYVGLRAAAQCNLAEAMWQIALGEVRGVEFSTRPIEFDANGNVSFIP